MKRSRGNILFCREEFAFAHVQIALGKPPLNTSGGSGPGLATGDSQCCPGRYGGIKDVIDACPHGLQAEVIG